MLIYLLYDDEVEVEVQTPTLDMVDDLLDDDEVEEF